MGLPISFFEVISPDSDRSRKFYTELFGWQANVDPALPEYAFVGTGADSGLTDGGIGPVTDADTVPGIKIYARVDDLESTLEKVNALGGSTLVPPSDLPSGFGRFALFADPDGNRFGLWKSS